MKARTLLLMQIGHTPRVIAPVTAQSIHDAQVAQWQERRQVERAAGVRIGDDGRILTCRQVRA